MLELIREEDFAELPDEPGHKWIQLERTARGRLQDFMGDPSIDLSDTVLNNQYMAVVNELAQSYDVKGISISGAANTTERLEIFQLAVSRAQTNIWSAGPATFPLGRVALAVQSKTYILTLTNDIEMKIDALDVSDKRKSSLYKILEDFRREINQPKTRIGTALTTLAQLSTVVAMSTGTLAQAPDAFTTIQMILGAEQLEAGGNEIQLIGDEKLLLLPAPQKQITGPS